MAEAIDEQILVDLNNITGKTWYVDEGMFIGVPSFTIDFKSVGAGVLVWDVLTQLGLTQENSGLHHPMHNYPLINRARRNAMENDNDPLSQDEAAQTAEWAAGNSIFPSIREKFLAPFEGLRYVIFDAQTLRKNAARLAAIANNPASRKTVDALYAEFTPLLPGGFGGDENLLEHYLSDKLGHDQDGPG